MSAQSAGRLSEEADLCGEGIKVQRGAVEQPLRSHLGETPAKFDDFDQQSRD